MIDHKREKLINLIIYFLKNTKYCGKTKLFKLLNFADFMHFKQTGKSITNLDYYAWEKGPVPKKLYNEFKNPPEDLKKSIYIPPKLEENEENGKYHFFKLKGKQKFNDKFFSKRELEIIKNIALIFKEAPAKDMVEVSHLKNKPWYKTYHKKGEGEKIDYMLALDESSESLTIEEIKERIDEIDEMYKCFD